MGESQSGASAGGHQLVIVALPSEDDPVHRFSSERVPHLTLLYLGDARYSNSEMQHVTEYVEHAASMLCRFGLDVESRGVLGDKNADVLFFNKRWSQGIAGFRRQLLADPLISRAYLTTDQFPDWTPHLTMGYPATPAKKDTGGYSSFSYVSFDRIAIFTGDYEGPTFQLKTQDYGLEVAMSQTVRPRGSLSHYGVKGMKWGVHRSETESGQPTAQHPTRVISDDVKAAINSQRKIAATGGTHSLSNQELQGLLTRMNLERQYSSMVAQPAQKSAMDRGHNEVRKYLAIGKTINDVNAFLKTPAGQAVKTGVSGIVSAGLAYATGGTSAAVAAGAGAVVRRAASRQ